MTTLRLAAAALVLAATLPPPVAAADGTRISVIGIRGGDAGKVLSQLEAALCGPLECVARSVVFPKGRLDFDAAAREGVAGMLFGTVSRRRTLDLALLTRSRTPEHVWTLPLGPDGAIEAAALAPLARELEGVLRKGQARPAPARTPPPPAAAAGDGDGAAAARAIPAPPRVPVATKEVAAKTEVARSTGAPVQAEPPAEPARRSGAKPAGPTEAAWLAIDLGTRLARRELSYSGAPSAGAPKTFEGGQFLSPQVRAEVWPFRRSSASWLRPLGAFASYARSVGFAAEESDTARRHDVTFSELEMGASYALPALSSGRLLLAPRLSYRSVSFVVEPTSGAAVVGLPDAALSGVAIGLDAELSLHLRFGLLAGAGYTSWTSAGDLVGDPRYFRSGSAWALDGEAGAYLRLGRRFSVRAVATYSRTAYTLSGSTTYSAMGAEDVYVGARAVVRAQY